MISNTNNIRFSDLDFKALERIRRERTQTTREEVIAAQTRCHIRNLSREYFQRFWDATLTEDSKHVIDARRLDLLPDQAIIVNTPRGGIVDDEVFRDRIERGQILAAGLDEFEGEPEVPKRLLQAPRMTVTPHLGSATLAARSQWRLQLPSGWRPTSVG